MGEKAGAGTGVWQFLILRASARCASFAPNWNSRPAPFLPSRNDASRKTHFLTTLLQLTPTTQPSQQSAKAKYHHSASIFQRQSHRRKAIRVSPFPTCVVVAIRRGREPGGGLSNPLLFPRTLSHQSRSLFLHIVTNYLFPQDRRFQQCPKCLGSRCRQKSLLHDAMRKV